MKRKREPVFKFIINWIESSNNAIEGILQATKTQRHIKFHLFAAFIVLLFCFVIGVEKNEFIIITLITLLVIVSEMFNTALEAIVDITSPKENKIAKIAKDIAAGAVLVSSVGAVIIGYLVLWPHLLRIVRDGFWISKHHKENITVLSVIVVMLIVIAVKAYLGKGEPLRGGFPSGHAAISFSIWISIIKMSTNTIVVVGSLIVAILVSINQVYKKIHSVLDVLMGAITGAAITLILYWIFY